MDKCSPVEMRKNLEVVGRYKSIGLDFVPVPVRDASHKNELLALGNEILEEILEEVES